jgi:flagellar assembly protein FliH
MILKRQTIAFAVEPRSVTLVGAEARLGYTESELKEVRESSFAEGFAKAAEECASEIRDLKEMMTALQDGVLQTLIEKQREMSAHIRSILPVLVMEAAERVIAGVKVDDGLVKAVVGDLMAEVAPGIENVEIRISVTDFSKMREFDATFSGRYPQARLLADPDLTDGDCIVRSKFGTLDGRIATKLRALEGALS